MLTPAQIASYNRYTLNSLYMCAWLFPSCWQSCMTSLTNEVPPDTVNENANESEYSIILAYREKMSLMMYNMSIVY